MADRTNKVGNNVPGTFYVDLNCAGCGVCLETAPGNLTTDETEGYSYVFKQPENDEEIIQCQDAMKSCPAENIGDDG